MNHRSAILLLALTALLWSMGGILVKSTNLHPIAIAGSRSFIACFVLLLVLKKPRFIWTKAQWGAAVCYCLTVIGFVSATKLTTAASAILLQYTAPVYVALLSGPILKERIVARDWIALSLIFAGLIAFFSESLSPDHMLGNLIALASGVSFAGIAIFLKLQNGKSTLESLLLGNALTAAIGIPFLLAGSLPTSSDISMLLALGILQLGLPYAIYGIAIRHVTALEATLVPVLEPILNPLWVAIFYAEIPGTHALIGGAIVVGAVIWHSVSKITSTSRTSY
jgi:drug/metabolite transporter (DMT)-like permease